MTRDEIIKLAREAGYSIRNFDGDDEVMDGDNYHIQTDLIERFAALVAAAEREKVARWQIGSGYTTGHGDTIEDLLKELEWQVRESERKEFAKHAVEIARKAVNHEREACAKVAESYEPRCETCPSGVSNAIRARGNK